MLIWNAGQEKKFHIMYESVIILFLILFCDYFLKQSFKMYKVAISWQHYELGQNMSISLICDQNQAIHEGFWFSPTSKLKTLLFLFPFSILLPKPAN